MRKKVSKLKGCIVSIDLFESQISMFIGKHDDMLYWFEGIATKQAFEKIKNDSEDNPIYDHIKARTYFPFGSGALIWLPKKNVNELSHEVFHAVYFLLKNKDTELNDDTEEVYAYTYAFVFDNLYHFMKKK